MAHPGWLHKKVREKDDKFRQQKVVDMFASSNRGKLSKKNSDVSCGKHVMIEDNSEDIEDFHKKTSSTNGPKPVVRCYDVRGMKHSVTIDSKADSGMQENFHDGACEPSSPLHVENIDKNVDYNGWLEIKKRKWKNTLDKRKKQRYVGFSQIIYKDRFLWLTISMQLVYGI